MNDLIDREALKEAMLHKALEADSGEKRWDGGCWIRYKMFERVLASMPSVQPEQKKGKWIESIRRVGTKFHPDCPDFYSVFVCAHCLKENDRTGKYCPNCGAEMEEGLEI